MTARAEHGHANFHSSGLCNLRTDLLAGQYTTETGFGSLAHLEFDPLHVGGVDRLEQSIHGEGTIGVAGAEISGSELKDEAASVAMVVADASLTGVVEATSDRRPAIE